jgi:type II secretory pathway component PulF
MSLQLTVLPLLGSLSGPNMGMEPGQFTAQMFAAVISFVLWAGGIFGSIALIHFLFTLPLRRAERARLFLDLLEAALNRRQSVEEMILSVAQTQDRTVGVHFHLLAAHIENGSRFGAALENVPGFLPPQLSAILGAGEKLGDFAKVLPAGREILRERPAAVRSAMHYLILVVLFFSPVFLAVLMLTTTFVIPRFRDVAAGMGARLWPETLLVFNHAGYLVAMEIIVFVLMAMAVLLYIGGPQFTRCFKFRQIPIVDWIAWHIAWKQKRLQRSFSAMLSVLLDGGVPEAEAVRLAGDCTANEISRRRAQHVIAALERGVKLEEAIRRFDHSGEFYWRLSNASQARGGFLDTLRGWHEALDAKAFQQEEAAAHFITTGVVIFNGALVALVATAMFGILVVILTNMLNAS